jgi:hypothetical protein
LLISDYSLFIFNSSLKMKTTLLIALLTGLAQLVLPWWIVGPIAFGACYFMAGSAGRAFAEGTAGVALVWMVYTLFIHFSTGGSFTTTMSTLLFKNPNAGLLLTAAPLVAGLAGGLAGLSGFYVRQLVQPRRAVV